MRLPRRLVGQGLLVIAFGLSLCPVRLEAFREPEAPGLPDFDRRLETLPKDLPLPTQAQARQKLRGRVPDLGMAFDRLLGTPRWIGSPHGFLSGPEGQGGAIAAETIRRQAPTDPYRAVKAFLDEHRALFDHGPEILETGRIKREFTTLHSGLRTVVWEQQLDGIPVFQSLLVAHLTRNGELTSFSSRFLRDPDRAARAGEEGRVGPRDAPKWTPIQAIVAAAQNLGINVDPAQVSLLDPAPIGPTRRQRFQTLALAGPVAAQLVWLPLHRNSLRLCWEIVAFQPLDGRTYRLILDATTGQAWVRTDLTQNLTEATYRVFTSDSPSPFSPGHSAPLTNQPATWPRTSQTLAALDTNASPNGWINDGVYVTQGNNARAHLDRDANNLADSPPIQGTTNRVFSFPMDLSRHPTNYGPASVVQLFYWCNWIHDTLYGLGFTEAAGNFQVNNFGRGGAGNDAVEADAQDGFELNNANMTTEPEDGIAPRLQMFLFNSPSPARDSALDAEVILHEYTHGLTTRRVGGGSGFSDLQSQGLAEGWSDFFALALLSEETDDPRGNYPFGAYVGYLLFGLKENYYYGIRRYPYTTDLTKNPLTFKDIDPTQADPHEGIPRNSTAGGGPDQVHRQGEVWASALWEARANLVARYGFAAGNRLMLQLVTDGLNLTPPNPDFLEARDAILLADLVNNNGANRQALWAGFAKRGMGYSAAAPSSTVTIGVQEAFDIPDYLEILPQGSLVFQGPVGGPLQPLAHSIRLSNLSTNALNWTAGHNSSWLRLSTNSGTIPPGQTNVVLLLSLLPEAYYLGPGIITNALRFTNLVSGQTQERFVALRLGQADPFTELFDSADLDLAFSSLTWVPDGSASFYRACLERAAAFHVDPAGGNVISLQDDGFGPVTLTGGTNIFFYGRATNQFFVCSNGYLTFDRGDNTINPNLDAHFSQARISALFTDLDPTSGGRVSWKPLPDRIAVTYLNVPRYKTASSNSFQIELFFDGTLRTTWLNLGTSSALVGLSPGGGLPAAFQESDLSAYESCTHTLALTPPPNAEEGDGTLPAPVHVLLTPPPPTNLTVTIRVSDPSQLQIPLTYQVAAGQSNLPFSLTILDDALLDGSQQIQLTASAPGYASATASLTIHDNESGVLSLSLPPTTSEGTGTIAGSISVNVPVAAPVRVRLISTDSTELAVPSEVLIHTGSNTATFNAMVVDDLAIDGPQPVQVTARVQNWTDGVASLSVQDNEKTMLALQAPSLVHEASGLLPRVGAVQITGTLPTNLVVALESSAPSLLAVTDTVAVPAGQTNATFDLGIVDNSTLDGHRTVVLTARVAGWSNGLATLQVFDDELPPAPLDPHPVDLASNVSVQTDLSWSLEEPGGGRAPSTFFDVYFGTSSNLGPADLQGSTTNRTWSLPPLAPLTRYHWRVVARRLGETSGPVWQFTSKGVDHFVWSPFASRQRVGTPWEAVLTAQDEFGTTVSNFHGAVRLEAVAPSGPNGAQIIISEVDPGVPDAVEFVNASTEELDLSNWRIWIYDSSRWPDPLLSFTVPTGSRASPGAVFRLVDGDIWPGFYPTFSAGTNFSWVHSAGNDPIAVLLQDAGGRLVDFFCAGGALPSQVVNPMPIPETQWEGAPLSGFENPSLTFQRTGDADQNNRLDWVPALATPGLVYSNLSLPFPDSARTISISPSNAGSFSDGQWLGQVTVFEPADRVRLRAEDAEGHVGSSHPFRVLLSNDVALTLTATPSPVVVLGSNLLYRVELFNSGPGTTSGLRLTNSLPEPVRLLNLTTSQGACTNLGRQVLCNLGDLPAGTNLVVSMLVVVESLGTLTNQVIATALNPDPNPDNNRAVLVLPTVPVPEVWAEDANMVEGNEGTNQIQFNVRLSTPVASEIQVDFLTADGTAQAGLDYLSSQGSVVFPSGTTLQTVAVPVLGEALPEGNETLLLILTNVVRAQLARSVATGTIFNDDPSPSISVGDATVLEGDTESTNARFAITLSQPSGLPVSVRYATLSVTAQAGLDYESRLGILRFPPGTTNLTVTVPVLGDRFDEGDEVFSLVLNSPTNGLVLRSTGVGTILDNDPLPILSIGDTSVVEGDTGNVSATFVVSLQPPSGRTVAVQYATGDETALANADYLGSSGTLLFQPGVSNQVVDVPVLGDVAYEPNETFLLRLSEPQLAELGREAGRGTIVNDDDQTGMPARLVWEPVTGPQQILQPFPVAISCLDPTGVLAMQYNGTAHIRAFAGGGAQGTILEMPDSPEPPQGVRSGPVTAGYAFTPSTNLLVTHVRHFFGSKVSIWTDSGELLASTAVAGPAGVWKETPLSPPLALPAHRRYRLAAYSGGTTHFWRTDGRPDFAQGTIHHSVSWEGDQFPVSADAARWYLVDLRYQVGATQELPVSPSVIQSFTNGLWTGTLQVGGSGRDVVLWAEDAQGHVGASNPFQVKPVNDLILTLTAAPSPVVVGEILTYRAAVSHAGPGMVSNVVLGFQLSESADLVFGFISQGSVQISNRLVLVQFGSLAADTAAFLHLELRPQVGAVDLEARADVQAQGAGLTTSHTAATVTTPVLHPVTIAVQPHNQSVVAGTRATFSVQAYGKGPLSYQWWRANSPIPGATNTLLSWVSAQISDADDYYVVVGNGTFQATSRVARLTVNPTVAAPGVGFLNVTVPPGYSLLANMLPKEDSTIGEVLPAVPPGTTVLKASENGYAVNNYLEGWTDPQMLLPPGEGFFFKNPLSNTLLITFTGKVLGGYSTNQLPAGLSLCSSIFAQQGPLSSFLDFPAAPGDMVFSFDTQLGAFRAFRFLEDQWFPHEPSLVYGQSLFVQKELPAAWIRFSTYEPVSGPWQCAPNPVGHSIGQVNFMTFHPNPALGQVFALDGFTPLATDFAGQLYGGLTPDESRFQALGEPISFQPGGAAGYLRGGLVTVPASMNAQRVFVQLRVWHTPSGPTYETARVQRSLTGRSAVMPLIAGASLAGSLPGLPPPDTSTFPSFAVAWPSTNSAPSLAPISPQVVHAQAALIVTNSASDNETATEALVFSLPHAPPDATINPTNGLLVWIPAEDRVSTTNLVTVRVTDDGDPPLFAEQTFPVLVLARPFLEQTWLSNGLMQLSWSAIPGVSYRVQYKTDLGEAAWNNLPELVKATNFSALLQDWTGTTTQRFYRVWTGP